MRAALFDMDRTLVRKETATLYVRYQREIGEASMRDLARVTFWVAQYTLGILDATSVARRAIATLGGTREAELERRCHDWFPRWVEEHVADAGRRAVERHRSEGDLIAIVTGATRYAAGPLARALGIEHIVATELEVDAAGCFTGQPIFPLCYGEGKLARATKAAERAGFDLREAAFYSDSYTDLPLLRAVGEPIVVNPDPRLHVHARRHGWRIEHW